MKRNGSFLLDLLSMVSSDNIVCYIQAPDIENLYSILSISDDPALMLMKTDAISLKIIEEEIKLNNIQDYIQYITFIKGNNVIYEGYDGLEYGIFSKYFNIPHWFIEKYEKYDCYGIATTW